MGSIYAQIYADQKERTIKANSDVIAAIRAAIATKTIAEYFATWKFSPRFLELTEILLCFPDGEEMFLALYDYILTQLKDQHIPAFIKKISTINCMQPLIVRDFPNTIEGALKSNNYITNNIINYMTGIINVPNGEVLLILRLDEILGVLHPTLISRAIKLLEKYPCFKVLVKTNFEKWLPMARGNAVIEMLDLILNIDENYALAYIKTNFEMILKNTGEGLVFSLLSILIKHIGLTSMIQNEVKTIIKYCSALDINRILAELDEQFNLEILKNNDIVTTLREKLEEDKKQHAVIGAIVKSQKSAYLKYLIKQIQNDENVNDFISIGDSTWSNIVFKIGNKVLKFGWIRNNPNCEQHYRLLELERFEIVYDEEGNPILYIEIQRYLSQENITEDDIQAFYDDLSNSGYLYIDPRGKNASNFGVLDSSVAAKIIESQPVSDSFKEKALVLIDRDCVWKKDDPNINWMGSY